MSLLTLSTTVLSSLSGELVLALGYGYEVQGPDDWRVNVVKKLTEFGTGTSGILLPGALLVNDLPFCEYSP